MNDISIPIGTDPLGAIRVELVGAARRTAAAQRRRRQLTRIVVAAAISLVSVVVGAVALGGADVPGIDLSGRASSGEAAPSTSAPLQAPAAPDGEQAVQVGFVSAAGTICTALSSPHGEGAGEAREGWGCIAPDALSRSLAGDTALLADVRWSGEATTVRGYAAADVERIVVKGPGGPFEARLGAAWTPDVAGAVTIRPFVAVGSDAEAPVASAVGDLRAYSVETRTEVGRAGRNR